MRNLLIQDFAKRSIQGHWSQDHKPLNAKSNWLKQAFLNRTKRWKHKLKIRVWNLKFKRANQSRIYTCRSWVQIFERLQSSNSGSTKFKITKINRLKTPEHDMLCCTFPNSSYKYKIRQDPNKWWGLSVLNTGKGATCKSYYPNFAISCIKKLISCQCNSIWKLYEQQNISVLSYSWTKCKFLGVLGNTKK